MKYKLENGKEITIPDKEIDKLVNGLDLSIEEAIQTYLEDNEYEINEQVEEMTQKAIALEYNISRSYISRIEKRALIQLSKDFYQ